ncbi:MAG: pentapeptide repeat-containing protein [Magnetovibrio sp.]|nr:pentapeptide repeat-containing protein [Magnetovibrio sp.]
MKCKKPGTPKFSLPLRQGDASFAGMASTLPQPVTPDPPVQTGVWFHVFTVLGIFTLLGGGIFVGVFSEAWGDYLGMTDAKVKAEALLNLRWSMGAAGTVILGSWGLALAAVRTHALDKQAKTQKKYLVFEAEKHSSEAFAKAIEQLGHEDFAVNLGAVSALEALARNSKTLHGTIFETLCAYVREKAPAPKNEERYIHADSPSVVVQAILTVIGRREVDHDPDKFRLDLKHMDLRWADMNEGRLAGAKLMGSNLYGADLTGAILENANLCIANLQYSLLKGSNLKGAKFGGANLTGIKFDEETNVSGADFVSAEHIPAQTNNDFRATVISSDKTKWPADDSPRAWDRD